ncbi:16498_t:CDS:2, partial [Entrophospora sp. SA101]
MTMSSSISEFPTNAISDDDDIKQQLMSVDPADPEIICILDVIYESCAYIEKGIPKWPNTERDIGIFYSRTLFEILTNGVDLHLQNALNGTSKDEGSKLDWLFSVHDLGKESYWGCESGLSENTGTKIGNKTKVSSNFVKSKKNLHDMLQVIDRTLPPRGKSKEIDEARLLITLPAIIYSSWRYHVIVLSALDSKWYGVSDIDYFDIPLTI